ncbi:MAG: sigma 54-interacting transcriptional regulator [Myxococcota bacterium]
MAFLLLVGRDEQVFPLRRHPLRLGRGSDQDVILLDEQKSVSRAHAQVYLERGRAYVVDQGSRNGTRVNGAAIVPHQPTSLEPGALIELGYHQLRYMIDEATPLALPTIVSETRPLMAMRDPSDTTELPTSTPARQRLSLLYQLCTAVQNLSDIQALLERFVQLALVTFKPERAFMGIYDPELSVWTHEIAFIQRGKVKSAFRLSPSITEHARKQGRAVLTREELAGKDSRLRSGTRATLCCPIVDDRDTIGMLYLDDTVDQSRFREDDVEFLGLLGLFAGRLLSSVVQHDLLVRRSQAMESGSSLVFGRTTRMQELQRRIHAIAATSLPVLLLGETGTGKTSFAKEIHQRSARRDGPFVKVNCAAIPETLLEAELFGYAPRSGIANADPKGKPGKFELAHGGTLFLDEIGDMPLTQQAKLLTVLEDREVYRLGSTKPVAVNVQIIAATAHPMEQDVAERRFRADLYHRLSRAVMTVPSLRERKEDLPELALALLQKLRQEIPKRISGISPEALEALQGYHWPGNIRELENYIAHAMIECRDGSTLLVHDFPSRIQQQPTRAGSEAHDGVRIRLSKDASELSDEDRLKRQELLDAIRETGSLTKASKKLGYSKQWVIQLARRYGIQVGHGKEES